MWTFFAGFAACFILGHIKKLLPAKAQKKVDDTIKKAVLVSIGIVIGALYFIATGAQNG